MVVLIRLFQIIQICILLHRSVLFILFPGEPGKLVSLREVIGLFIGLFTFVCVCIVVSGSLVAVLC